MFSSSISHFDYFQRKFILTNLLYKTKSHRALPDRYPRPNVAQCIYKPILLVSLFASLASDIYPRFSDGRLLVCDECCLLDTVALILATIRRMLVE